MSRAWPDRFVVPLVFLGAFALYLASAAPQLAAYRDAGEMAIAGTTLGVAHPPGYPLYVLFGRVAAMAPLGNAVYRLNVLSAVAGALAVAFLYVLLRTWVARLPAFGASLALALSNPFWELSGVSEMYTLGAWLLILILVALFRLESPELAAFVAGLALGVRMDLLLLMPVFALYAAFRWRNPQRWLLCAACLAAGATIYLYLPLRSATDPWLDWGNPETLSGLLRSVTRASYGGGLDLIAAPFEPGANFPANIAIYGRHLASMNSWALGVAGLAGAAALWRRDRRLGLLFAGLFVLGGPVFIFLANLPPNPHAVAILEASFVLPDVLLACLAGFGLALMGGRARWLAPLVVLIGFAPVAAQASQRAIKRDNAFGRDYATNVFRSAPRGAIAIFTEDVQLFSLWCEQLLRNRRPDLSIISRGLSSSSWYASMVARWPTARFPAESVKNADSLGRFLEKARPRIVAAGFETDVDGFRDAGFSGLLRLSGSTALPPENHALRLANYRGRYVHDEAPDFFSSDLISDYARAFHHAGLASMRAGNRAEADAHLRKAIALDPDFAQAVADRAYLAYVAGDFDRADAGYAVAAERFERLLKKAAAYRTVPSVVRQLRLGLARCETHLGVLEEKRGNVSAARERYRRSLLIEDSAQANYNLAVTYWGADWPVVVRHLRRAVDLDPGMTEARSYLARAEQALNRGGPR